MGADYEKSGLHALRELRAMEGQRLREEAELRAREEMARRRRDEDAARELEREARARAADEARAVEERAKRSELALEAARLRGELAAAMERIALLDVPAPLTGNPSRSTVWPWILAAGTTALAIAFGMALALRTPEIRDRPFPVVHTVPASCPTPTPSPSPVPPLEARTPPVAPPHPRHPHRPSADLAKPAPSQPRDCGDDPIFCHMDADLDDINGGHGKAKPQTR